MTTLQFAFDKQTSRSRDADGRMRVKNCILSTAEVNPYNGREIPGWEAKGLDPDKVYHLHRTPEALAASVPTWEGNPLMLKHIPSTANAPAKEHKAGSVHSIKFDGKHLRGDLLVDDGQAIDLIESEKLSDLSGGYRYKPNMTLGVTSDGKAYDGTMDNIQGNHVALVDDGRATGAHVADAAHKTVLLAGDAAVAKKVQEREQQDNPALNTGAAPAAKTAAAAPGAAAPGAAASSAAPAAVAAPDNDAQLAKVGEALKHIATLIEAIQQPPGGDNTMSKANDKKTVEDRERAHDAELRKRYSEDKRRSAFDKARDEMADDAKEAEDAKGAFDKECEDRKAEDARREAYDAERDKDEAEDAKNALPEKDAQEGNGARGEKTPHGAMDAKSVATAIDAAVTTAVAAERKRASAIETATRDVRDVLGEVYGMDSADAIYRAALEQAGVDLADIPAGSEKVAFTAYKAATAKAARPSGYALDSAAANTEKTGNQTNITSLLNRISVKG